MALTRTSTMWTHALRLQSLARLSTCAGRQCLARGVPLLHGPHARRYSVPATPDRTFEGHIGVGAALQRHNGTAPHTRTAPPLAHEFSLADRVALVTGANGGIGLEMALALAEAGARAVYCVDLPAEPSDTWKKVQAYAGGLEGGARLEYLSGDVTDQKLMWDIGKRVGDEEGRLDVCVAAAGIIKEDVDCLDYPAEYFKQVLDVNTSGVLFTAQAAGKQMVRFGHGGSIILVASTSAQVAIQDMAKISYNASKGAVVSMTRSMACELAPRGVRVNSLSPGWMYTKLTADYIEKDPTYFERLTPMRRVGRTHELRGVTAWLASDASSFCTGSDIIIDGAHRAW